jgi:hypothetical protein
MFPDGLPPTKYPPGSDRHPVNGTSKVDLLFRLDGPPVEFIADITAVSDKGLNELNRVHALNEEFWRYLKKNKLLISGGFHVQVDQHTRAIYRGSDEKVDLKIPEKRAEWDIKIFNNGFRSFLKKVKQFPVQQHRFDAVDLETGVHFTYDPWARGTLGGGHASFDLANIINSNPVYNALKKKGDQLKSAGFSGIAGVILCDGGCQTLHSPSGGWQAYGVEEIIKHFFDQFDSTAFVVTFVVKGTDRNLLIEPALYLNPKHSLGNVPLGEIFFRLHQLLPPPQFTPLNVLGRLKARDTAGRYYGTMTMADTVKMSSRHLSEVLAGRTTIQELYTMKAEENPFEKRLAEGRLITRVTVEPVDGEDDDTVTIEFGEPDVAASPFRLPIKP